MKRTIKIAGVCKAILYSVPVVIINFFLNCDRVVTLYRVKKKADQGFVIREINGSKMVLDVNDEGLPQQLIMNPVREPYSMQVVSRIIEAGNCVVDIGANMGYYALFESRLVGENGVVYAIEPVKRTFEILQHNIALNNYCNIETANLGIGERKGTAAMFLGKQSNLNSMNSNLGLTTSKVDVEINSLDNFLRGRRYPKFIRMDVEGYEYEILKGMSGLLNDNSRLIILMELHFQLLDRKQSAMILDTLNASGFKILTAIFEPTVGIRNGTLLNLLDSCQMKLHSAPIRSGYWQVSIDDLLRNQDVMEGKLESLEIFFER